MQISVAHQQHQDCRLDGNLPWIVQELQGRLSLTQVLVTNWIGVAAMKKMRSADSFDHMSGGDHISKHYSTAKS